MTEIQNTNPFFSANDKPKPRIETVLLREFKPAVHTGLLKLQKDNETQEFYLIIIDPNQLSQDEVSDYLLAGYILNHY